MVNLPDEHLIAVGRVTVAAGQLEARLHVMLETVVDPDPHVLNVLIGSARFDRRLQVAAAIVQSKRPAGPWPQFDAWAVRAKEAMNERNRLLHGEWVPTMKFASRLPDALPLEEATDVTIVPGLFTRRRQKGDYLLTLHPDAVELDGAAIKLEELCDEADELLEDMVEWGATEEDDSGGRHVSPRVPRSGSATDR